MSAIPSQRPPPAHYMPHAAPTAAAPNTATGSTAALPPHASLPPPNVALASSALGGSAGTSASVNGGGSNGSGGGSSSRRTSPRTATSARSPRSHSGQLANLPPTHVLAQQLSVQLQQAGGVRKHSKSAPTSPMHRPARDLALGLAPLSTITPIDDIPMAAAGSVPNGAAPASDPRLNGYHHGHSHSLSGPVMQGVGPSGILPMSGLAPPAHIDAVAGKARSPSHSPSHTAPRLSPEVLRPLSQLNHAGARHAPPQRGATIPPVHAQQQARPAPSYYSQADTEPGRRARRRAGSNPRPPSSASSDDTETEVDSDSTFVPGRMMRRGHSRSQPDLTALRSRLAENWATQQQEERREVMRQREAQASSYNNNHLLTRRKSQGRSRTPPSRSATLPQGGSGSGFSSALPQGALGLRHSPRASTIALAHLTPITQSALSPRTDSSAEESPWGARTGLPGIPLGGMTGSEDGDDDIGSTDSPSSGSLSFSPKRHRARVRALADRRSGTALGLMLEPNSADERSSGSAQATSRIDLRAASIEARLRRSSLLNFRLLAVVPALWGSSVLLTAMVNGALWHEVWPWGVDLSRDALERLVQGSHVYQGIERPVHRGDMVLAMAWALVTAHFCFMLTTGLTHRWRSYYSLPSTVTRLVSLQCLCWPATYITLWFLGPRRPLLAWVVIGVTTGWSRTVQMWVTSNVVDTDAGGDVTPGPRRSPPTGLRPPPPPKHVTGWRKFTYGRRWDWDAVAREVGYKVSALLLVTVIWLFWRIDGLETKYGDL